MKVVALSDLHGSTVALESASTVLKDAVLVLLLGDLTNFGGREEAEEVRGLLKDCMEGSMTLRVPLVVEVKVGRNWLEAH